VGEKKITYKDLAGNLATKKTAKSTKNRNIFKKNAFEKIVWGVWTGFIWHRIGTSDGLL
jgi:hypothetical protein